MRRGCKALVASSKGLLRFPCVPTWLAGGLLSVHVVFGSCCLTRGVVLLAWERVRQGGSFLCMELQKGFAGPSRLCLSCLQACLQLSSQGNPSRTQF